MEKHFFPKNFIFGTNGIAFQMEGGWNEDGKGETIWDRYCQRPGIIRNGDTNKVASDFYHKYPEDIEMMAELGYKGFEFSICWARILPKGTGEVNQKGIDYYRDLFTKIKAKGINLMVTLYAWDLPQALQDRGGWTNREMIKWFADYSEICFREFGDLVDEWITILEPTSISIGYNGGGHIPPGHNDIAEMLQVAHIVNLAHGACVKTFRKSGLKSRIGVKLSIHLAYPDNPNSESDKKMAGFITRMMNHFYLDPLYKGEYPIDIWNSYKDRGITMPEIMEGDMELMNQPLDFFALNAYSPMYTSSGAGSSGSVDTFNNNPTTRMLRSTDLDRHLNSVFEWEVMTNYMYDCIHFVKDNYNPSEIIVTEGGYSDNDWPDEEGNVNDPNRITYIRNDLRQIYKCIEEGINLTGYYVHSYMDNFGARNGLQIRFGLIYINHNTLERIPKSSAYWYSEASKTNSVIF